jgi:hypothetical protein
MEQVQTVRGQARAAWRYPVGGLSVAPHQGGKGRREGLRKPGWNGGQFEMNSTGYRILDPAPRCLSFIRTPKLSHKETACAYPLAGHAHGLFISGQKAANLPVCLAVSPCAWHVWHPTLPSPDK